MNVMVVDDDPLILSSMERFLRKRGISVSTCAHPAEALEVVRRHEVRVVVSDILMPKMSGMELLKEIKSRDPLVEVILMTGSYTIEAAVEAVKQGAYDYLPKPVDLGRLEGDISAISSAARLRGRTREVEKQLTGLYNFHGMVGKSPAMLSLFSLIQRVAPHFRTVLVTGETGTGKELVAKALHQLSPRLAKRFVVCNTAALARDLMESELFGHVKGAFTGAVTDRDGLFQYADGGTVFLDEIGEMPLSLQAKLLRVLENREVQKVGSNRTLTVDVAIVAATNRNLRAEVERGRFREDLYHRLGIVELTLPTLRERREDIPLLCDHFLESLCASMNRQVRGISLPAKEMLLRYPWEGNVRQLQNTLERAMMVASADFISLADLPGYIVDAPPESGGADTLDSLEKRQIEKTLAETGGNKQLAAKLLGLSRQALYRKLNKHLLA